MGAVGMGTVPIVPRTPMANKYGGAQVTSDPNALTNYLKTDRGYQVTYGGKDFTGTDILSGIQQQYFNDKYGEYPWQKQSITDPTQTTNLDGSTSWRPVTREGYVLDTGTGGMSDFKTVKGETFAVPSDYAKVQMRQPLSTYEEPLINLLSNVHQSNLVSSNNYLDDEVAAYQQAVKAYTPYITGTNPDGTVNISVPKGSDLGLTQFIEGKRISDNRQEMVKSPSKTQQDLVANGVTLLGDRSKIVEMLLGGGGFLNRYKQSVLETPVDAARQGQRAGTNYTGKEASEELAAAAKYKTAVGKYADYNRLRGIQRQIGGGTSSSTGSGAPGVSEDNYLKLFKPSLLG